MAYAITTSGTPYNIVNVSHTVLRTILLEKTTTALPAGVTKSGGNPPTWIQFADPATGPGGDTYSINPNNVEAIQGP